MKNKRQQLQKDCERFGISDVFDIYKNKLQSNKNPKIHHLAWVVYSDYLLLLKSKDGKCCCVTCGKIDDWYSSDMHPWHFRTAWSSLKYKFVDDNVHPQCIYCNVMLNGNYQKYTLYMIDKFGRDRVDNILQDKEIYTIKNWEYWDMIQKWWTFIINRKNE